MPPIHPSLRSAATVACALGLISISLPGRAAEGYFDDWPEGANPKAVGTRLTERFLETPHSNFGKPEAPKSITYPESVAWYGAMTFAEVSKQPKLTKALVARFEPFFHEEAHLIPNPHHVDPTVFGALACELYLQTGDERYGQIGRRFANTQWKPPQHLKEKFDEETKRNVEQGLSWQTRFWIDDMYMITMAQGQAFRASKDPKYVDRAAKEMVAYLDKLQEPNGLFYHAPDVPFFWGRGDGWMASGMAELLRILPSDNPDRGRIIEGYRKMMATLKDCQGGDGMWRQLIDDPESWPETSCTAMFTFAMITGVKEGLLDSDTYGPVARKGWIALTKYINEAGDVREVCVGTNKKNSREHYMTRPRATGDLHGQAPMLWCATALLR